MNSLKVSRYFYIYIIAYLIFDLFFSNADTPLSGNLLRYMFATNSGNQFMDTMFGIANIAIIPASAVLMMNSEGSAKSHFRNIFTLNLIMSFSFIFVYDDLLNMERNPEYFGFSLLFVLPVLIYVLWRIIRGTYLCFNNREISNF